MPDGWEYHNGLNLEVNDATLDPDRDGLGNLLEYQIGTKANAFDTDRDGCRCKVCSVIWFFAI
jgi:hypothetical protein